jgi:hypothetical protein
MVHEFHRHVCPLPIELLNEFFARKSLSRLAGHLSSVSWHLCDGDRLTDSPCNFVRGGAESLMSGSMACESQFPHGPIIELARRKPVRAYQGILEARVIRAFVLKNRHQASRTRNRPRDQLSTLLKGQREIGHIALPSPIIA